MLSFLHRHWYDLVPLIGHAFLIPCLIWILSLQPYSYSPIFTIGTIIFLIILLITGTITIYTFIKKVQNTREQEEP